MSLSTSETGERVSLRLPRLVVSSICGGGGKTLLSLGLSRALSNRGLLVLPFKKGPDYIDAAWLSGAARYPASNLDPHFLDGEGLRAQLAHSARTLLTPGQMDQAIAVVEGNRGLYDGLDVEGTCSTSALAREIAAPVVLALNVTKMTRTAAAILQGLQNFEKVDFAGVVLNCTGSARHATYVRRSIEAYTDLQVLGELPRLDHNPLPERHMGIASFRGDSLSETAQRVLETLATHVGLHVDLESIVEKACKAPALSCGPFWTEPVASPATRPNIGYVRDACLWFYYRENLEALDRAGARLTKLSLFDDSWPLHGEGALDGIYLGGGFPEDFLDNLENNPRLQELAGLSAAGFPVYAECGGLMVLARTIRNRDRVARLAGVLPLDIEIGPRPMGLGYVHGEITGENPWYPAGSGIVGHEFHYSRACLDEATKKETTLRLSRGMGLGEGLDGLVSGNTWASYTHIFAPAHRQWAPTFVRLALEWRARREKGQASAG